MLRLCPRMTNLRANVVVWDSVSIVNMRDASTPPADQRSTAAAVPIPNPASQNIRVCRCCSAPVTSEKIQSQETHRPVMIHLRLFSFRTAPAKTASDPTPALLQ